MALVLKDRVKETSTTAGTGTITLAGAVSGFQSFASVGNGNTTYYGIADPTTGDWEVGIGTYTSSGTTLSRDTVLSSSNSGSLVSFTSNQKDVFVTYPSEKAVWQDASGVVVQQAFGAITATSAALTTGTVSTTPTSNTDIANKQYVDTISASGIHYHEPVFVESPDTAGNLNATYNNGASGVGATLTNAGTQVALTIDGVLMTTGKRVLIYNQTNAAQNGVYTVTTVGSGSTNWVLTRATDADTYSPFSPNSLGQGDAFFVTNGLTGAGETYICNTVGTITFGTTAITFAQISDSTLYTAGTGLTLTGTEFSITPTGTAGTYGSASSVPVLTTNASGQVTSVTNTTIAINGSQVSGNISGSAGSVANALTLGTYLTGGTYNGSAAVTATVDATSANTASKVVARDSSGNFSAGTITATLSGSATSATTATNLAGGAANQIAYQSASGTTSFATAPSASNQVLNWNGSAFTWSAGTISGVPLGSNLNSLTAGTYLTGTAYNGSAAQTWTVDATSANTASKVVARDASGNFSAGTITATLSGNASTATSATTATNLAGGSAGTIPYQSAAGTTVQLGAGTSGYILQSNGAAAPSWVVASTAAGVNNGTLTLNTSGTGLSGSQTFTANQSGAATFTVTSNATSANTASTIVARDASGNFSAGTITAALSGNATTATTASTVTTIGTTQVTNLYSPNGTTVVSPDTTSAMPAQGQSFIHTLGTGPGGNDGHLLAMSWSNTTSVYGAQIFVDTDPTGTMALRQRSSGGVWTSWNTFLTSGNYNSYAPTLTGTGASGTWSINVTGSAGSSGSVTGLTLTSSANGINPDSVTQNQLGYNTSVSLYGQTDGGLYSSAYSSSWIHQIYGDFRSGQIAVRGKNSGTWQSWYYIPTYSLNNGYSTGSLYAGIYYDSNNTAYYLDAANSASAGALSLNGGITFGISNPYLTASSYFVVPGGAYFNSGTVYMEANLKARGGVGNDNAAALTLTGGTSGWTQINGSARSPIFYDSDNTGYYVDPASTTYLYSLQLSGNTYFRPNSWIQFDGNYGIYSTAYNGAHFLANAQSSYGAWRMIGSRNSYAGIYDDYSGVTTGMFDSAGNGGFYREANGRWYQYHNVSNNCTGFGTSTTNSAYNIYCPTGVYSGGRVDGTIFYDSNNTGYYVDPASTSILNVLNCYGNVTAYYSSDIKFKTNVRDIPNAIETVESIGGKLFDWTDEYLEEHGGEDPYFMRKEDFGVVAQDVLKVFPVAVRTRPDGSLAVDYEKLSALAFAAVAELSTRVKSLEARI